MAPTDKASGDIAIATICNDAFVPGARMLMHSVMTGCRGAHRIRWIVLHGGGICTLSPGAMRELGRLGYPITFRNVEEHPSFNVPIPAPSHRPAFLKLDILRLKGFEKLLYVDSDMLCINDISDLFDLDCDIAMAPSRSNRAGEFNTGLIVLDGRLMDGTLYEQAIAQIHPTTEYMLDQPILNKVLLDNRIAVTPLSIDYNYQYVVGHPDIKDESDLEKRRHEIKMLHWNGQAHKRKKPWEDSSGDALSMRLWRDAWARMEASLAPP